ncbi:acetate--CoA ligase family protein [Paenalcaligenes sp. Me131]|uniref:acetate--CoA ligase family protein n=1 Tax=Paenalcaligenes sp. Me131 TaxID=3392636 RepID=UPI003D2764F7
MSAKKENLRHLMNPSSIVLVGGSSLERPIQNIRHMGYEGKLWVINPHHSTIAGEPCLASLHDLPEVPDAAFIAVNAQVTVEVVQALRELGCKGAVCYAAGFAEMGETGEQLQQALVDAAGDMALVGPNCYGILNFVDKVALWPDRLRGERVYKGIAIISQSGNVALNLTMHDRSLPITHVISVGNQASLEVGDYIDLLLDDKRVSAIGLYIEGLKDVARFSHVALRALHLGIPLVVLKTGVSELGAQLALSHTSSLAGRDDMYQALFERFALLRVESLSAMVETLKLAALTPIPHGNKIGVLTCSGGDSALLADALEQQGLHMPALSTDHNQLLDKWLPSFASRSNPLDYNTSVWGNLEASTAVFSTMMHADFDAVVLALDFPQPNTGHDDEWQCQVNALIAASREANKTIAVISNFVELLPENARQRLEQAGIAPLQGLQDGVTALAKLVTYHQQRQRSLAYAHAVPLTLHSPQTRDQPIRMLDEHASKNLLAQYGLSVPKSVVVTLEQLIEQAHTLDYPVVLKALSAQIAHKTELGAVSLNLSQPTELIAAATTMAERLAAQNLPIEHFLIEQMVSDGVGELIIGVKRDPLFGPALILGTGGVLVNLLNDSAIILLPTSPEMIRSALMSLKGTTLLQGFRNKAKGDLDAVINAVMAVARFVQDHWDSVHELDVNPLIVRPTSTGVIAVDALIYLHAA